MPRRECNGLQFVRTPSKSSAYPGVDTCEPFIARVVPTPDENRVVIRFANPRGIDIPCLLGMLRNAFMCRANTRVVAGATMETAMQPISRR